MSWAFKSSHWIPQFSSISVQRDWNWGILIKKTSRFQTFSVHWQKFPAWISSYGQSSASLIWISLLWSFTLRSHYKTNAKIISDKYKCKTFWLGVLPFVKLKSEQLLFLFQGLTMGSMQVAHQIMPDFWHLKQFLGFQTFKLVCFQTFWCPWPSNTMVLWGIMTALFVHLQRQIECGQEYEEWYYTSFYALLRVMLDT